MTVTTVTWTGIDGSVWNLRDGAQGVSLARGLSGLHLPQFTQQTTAASRIPGKRYVGTAWESREVQASLVVGDIRTNSPRRGDAWRALDAAWWSSVSPEIPGTLTVVSERGSRSLSCRLAEAPDPNYSLDPAIFGKATYEVTLESENPFWTGPDVPSFAQYQVAQANYYGGSSGVGPPFVIAGSTLSSNLTITNPGDRPAYSRWVLTGPGTITFSIGSHSTTIGPLAPSQVVSINTDPVRANAVRDISYGGSVDYWPFIGAHDFWVPIPAGAVGYPIPVSFSGGAVGVTSVSVTLTPLYTRAW